ncbi:hypothetical protein R3P38DRAFT_2506982, partial [Favolaschia claudopus]
KKYDGRDETLVIIIDLATSQNLPDLAAWKRLREMLKYLGTAGMSSEEELQIAHGRGKKTVFRVKVCLWRAIDVSQYLWMIDERRKSVVTGKSGAPPVERLRDGTPSTANPPTGLPRCLYNENWIEMESKKSPIFMEELNISKEAFELLTAAPAFVA